MSKNATRIVVLVSHTMMPTLNKLVTEYGASRSAFIAQLIRQACKNGARFEVPAANTTPKAGPKPLPVDFDMDDTPRRDLDALDFPDDE